MMSDTAREQRAASLRLVNRLLRRGRRLAEDLNASSLQGPQAPQGPHATAFGSDGSSRFAAVLLDVRAWQQECAAAINELSGSSKAHWLSRAFSAAFLVPATAGSVVVDADVAEIVDRLLDVLSKARASIEVMDDEPAVDAAPARRFDFVHDAKLRPVLEEAYRESSRMLQRGSFELALVTSSGMLETILTDALEHARQGADAEDGRGANVSSNMATWSFETRIAEAERAGLIRRGCARLPQAARAYREGGGAGSNVVISERDARITRQVLHVVMRDLDPGR